MKLLLIGAGGAAGALLRYWVSGIAQAGVGGGFPLGTLVVNALGCLGVGFLAALFSGPILVSPELRAALLVGLLGGFTTFSTFAFESFALMNDGQWRLALANMLLSNVLGIVGCWLGFRIYEVMR